MASKITCSLFFSYKINVVRNRNEVSNFVKMVENVTVMEPVNLLQSLQCS